MASSPDSIDGFLASLGLEIGGKEWADKIEEMSKMPEKYPVAVLLFEKGYFGKEITYCICCYAKGFADDKKLKDILLGHRVTARLQIDNETLINVCQGLEKKLDEFQIEYNRDDPPRGLLSPQHMLASYRLINRMSDPLGNETRELAIAVFQDIVTDYKGDIMNS